MHFGKCPIHSCCLDGGEVILLFDTPVILKQKANVILAGSRASSLDPDFFIVKVSAEHEAKTGVIGGAH